MASLSVATNEAANLTRRQAVRGPKHSHNAPNHQAHFFPVGAASTAISAAARLPRPEAVGAEAPPKVHPVSLPQVPVGAASAATSETACFPAAQRAGTEVPPTVHPVSRPQVP